MSADPGFSETIEQELSAWMRTAFAAVFPQADLAALPLHVVATTDAAFGDYQCNAALAAAKVLQQKPCAIAEAFCFSARLQRRFHLGVLRRCQTQYLHCCRCSSQRLYSWSSLMRKE